VNAVTNRTCPLLPSATAGFLSPAHPYIHTHTHTNTHTRYVPLYIPHLTFPQPINHTQKHTTLHSIHRHTTYHSSIHYRYGITAFLYPKLMPEDTLTLCNWHCIGGLWRCGNGDVLSEVIWGVKWCVEWSDVLSEVISWVKWCVVWSNVLSEVMFWM